MSWLGFFIVVVVLLIGYFTGTLRLRPTGLLSRTQPDFIAQNRLTTIVPFFLAFMGFGLFSTFGYNGIWYRLTTDLDGAIVSRQDLPRTPSTHPATVYQIVQGDNSVTKYTAIGGDASLPRNLRVGARIVKRKWELSWTLNGERVDDFPLPMYVGFLGLATVLWSTAGYLAWRGRAAGKTP